MCVISILYPWKWRMLCIISGIIYCLLLIIVNNKNALLCCAQCLKQPKSLETVMQRCQTLKEGLSFCSLSQIFFLSSLQISDSELLHWKQLVAKCMAEYCSSACNKPDNKKLLWIVSKKTAQSLQCYHYRVPGLPTIPEGSWDKSER